MNKQTNKANQEATLKALLFEEQLKKFLADSKIGGALFAFKEKLQEGGFRFSFETKEGRVSRVQTNDEIAVFFGRKLAEAGFFKFELGSREEGNFF